MLLLGGIFVLFMGLIMALSPATWWELTESWKSYSASEPSDFYIKITRAGGVFFSLAGLGGIIGFFLLK